MKNARAPQMTDSNNVEPTHRTAFPLPGSDAYAELSQFPATKVLPFRRTVRRTELRQIVPLADTTIYDMERRGEFPRRFNLTLRCVVWDLDEVEAWIEARKQASQAGFGPPASGPDVRLRRNRPVRKASSLP
jgi:prophage regulatory protein